MELEQMKGLFEEALLSSSEEEVIKIADEIHDDVMEARILKELDFADVDPLHLLTDSCIELREDIVEEGMDREEALSYASEREYGYFKIKRVIE